MALILNFICDWSIVSWRLEVFSAVKTLVSLNDKELVKPAIKSVVKALVPVLDPCGFWTSTSMSSTNISGHLFIVSIPYPLPGVAVWWLLVPCWTSLVVIKASVLAPI